jgi:hypothetical protein
MVLAGEVMPVGVAAASSVQTGVRHLVSEESVVAGHLAPTRDHGRAEVVGGFAVSGYVVVPGAVRAALPLFVLLPG